MKLVFYIPYLASILVAACMALFYRKEIGPRNLAILGPYLLYVLLQESVLGLGFYFNFYPNNSLVYNLYRPFNVLVFFWVYYNIPFMKRFRPLMLWVTIAYIAITIISYCFIESILQPSNYLAIARGFVITLCAVLFLFGYFGLDNLSEEKFWHPLVWITAGIVIFYPVVTISLNFQKYLASQSVTFYGLKLYQVIPQVMSIFMYSCFSYAFYLCRRKS